MPVQGTQSNGRLSPRSFLTCVGRRTNENTVFAASGGSSSSSLRALSHPCPALSLRPDPGAVVLYMQSPNVQIDVPLLGRPLVEDFSVPATFFQRVRDMARLYLHRGNQHQEHKLPRPSSNSLKADMHTQLSMLDQ